eukprot:1339252-Amorphochlora_amoeboformis.AAC.2
MVRLGVDEGHVIPAHAQLAGTVVVFEVAPSDRAQLSEMGCRPVPCPRLNGVYHRGAKPFGVIIQ